MNLFIVTILLDLYIQSGECLWRRGIVHYAINKKDYDYHSQDIIISTFEKIQREICVKFFNTPMNYSANEEDKILYISNADKRKDCPREEYDFDETVVDMKIGYKCLNENDIARMVVEMLRASIRIQGRSSNLDTEQDGKSPSGLLSLKDRNFINSQYHNECGELVMQPIPVSRRFSTNIELSKETEKYYQDKLWPLGVVIYSAEDSVMQTRSISEIRSAMNTIELASCIVFHELDDDQLIPKNFLWFSQLDGEVMPKLGFVEGNQTLLLSSMVNGAPGHTGHTINMLLRVLGVPMMSNRYDRDNYVTVHWKNVQKGMEHYLERMPEVAMLRNSDGEIMQYDYTSVTHAPSNYLCADCSLGQQTVSPIQDHLWQRTLTMGCRSDLNPSDIEILNLLYSKECRSRLTGND